MALQHGTHQHLLNHYPDFIYGELPLRPAESFNYKTGLLTKQSDYRYLNNAYKLVRETQISYNFSETATQGLRINFQGGIASTATMYKFEVGPYSTNLGFAQPVYTADRMMYNDSTILSEKWISYDSALQNVVSQTQTASNSNAEKLITEFFYPQDFSSTIAVAPQMAARNMLGIPLETITKFARNGAVQITGGSYQSFSTVSGSLRLMDTRKLRVPLMGGGFSYAKTGTLDSRYDVEISNSSFDNRGNVGQIIRRGGQPTTILWGFKQSYPIAEIKNATYDAVSTALSQQGLTPSTIGTISTTVGSGTLIVGNLGTQDNPTIIRSRLETLRKALPTALIWSATYRPLIGMDSQSNPDNRTTFYTYDGALRLQHVKANSQYILKTHSYNYRNGSQ